MRRWVLIAAAAGWASSPAIAGDPIAPVHPGASATKARDIDGFELGSPIREAAKRIKVTWVQGDQVQGKLGDTDVTFEICPSGAIYMIETTQPLGRFIVDKTFLDGLDAKLFAKFGKATGGTPDNLGWDLTEPVRYTTGEQHPFTTNWMTALVSESYGDPVTLDLKMLDFRICWAEKEKANVAPRNRASGAVRF
jgi:hypothetical protein